MKTKKHPAGEGSSAFPYRCNWTMYFDFTMQIGRSVPEIVIVHRWNQWRLTYPAGPRLTTPAGQCCSPLVGSPPTGGSGKVHWVWSERTSGACWSRHRNIMPPHRHLPSVYRYIILHRILCPSHQLRAWSHPKNAPHCRTSVKMSSGSPGGR
jgi:hypothetical protein